jgi:phage recombination protein Bet
MPAMRSTPAAVAVAAGPPTVTREQLDLIKRTVAPDATDAELQLFLHDCARRGVHPLDRLIYFTKRGARYTPVTSIDFMRSQAAATGEMAGSDDATFVLDEDGAPWSATVTVYRLTQSQRFAYTATARLSEYYPGDGGAGTMWRKMPHTMLGKCAEALALRKAFPQQLAGLYASEELQQADRLDEARGMPPAATPGVPVPPVEKPRSTITMPQRTRLFAIASDVGWKKDELKAWLLKTHGLESTEAIERADYEQIIAEIQAGGTPPAHD